MPTKCEYRESSGIFRKRTLKSKLLEFLLDVSKKLPIANKERKLWPEQKTNQLGKERNRN